MLRAMSPFPLMASGRSAFANKLLALNVAAMPHQPCNDSQINTSGEGRVSSGFAPQWFSDLCLFNCDKAESGDMAPQLFGDQSGLRSDISSNFTGHGARRADAAVAMQRTRRR